MKKQKLVVLLLAAAFIMMLMPGMIRAKAEETQAKLVLATDPEGTYIGKQVTVNGKLNQLIYGYALEHGYVMLQYKTSQGWGYWTKDSVITADKIYGNMIQIVVLAKDGYVAGEYTVSGDAEPGASEGLYTVVWPEDGSDATVTVSATFTEKPAEPDPETGTTIKEEGFDIDLFSQYIVLGGGDWYYQIVKDDKKAKKNAWIPAEVGVVDISTLTKTTVFAFSKDNTAEGVIVDDNIVTVPLNVAKVKAVIDPKVEYLDELLEALSYVELTFNGGNTVKYSRIAGDGEQSFRDLKDKGYIIQWKRGSTTNWCTEGYDEAYFGLAYQALKSSNGTLYLRTYKENELCSKEIKVKIAKTAKAPDVKPDYAKGTLAIKDGMEFRVGNDNWEDNENTYYVLSKTPAGEKATAEPNKWCFSKGTPQYADKGAKCISVYDLIENIDGISYGSKSVKLFVRTSATSKKYASYAAVIVFDAPEDTDAGSMAAATGKNSKGKTVAKLTVPEAGKKYEYYFSSKQVTDFTNVKFTGAATTTVELAKTADTAKADAAVGQYVYVRKAGDKNEKTFPGRIIELVVADASEKTVTFALTVTGAPNGTASVMVDKTAVESVKTTGEAVVFTVETTENSDDFDYYSDVTVTIGGETISPDSDGNYTTGAVTSDTTVNVSVAYRRRVTVVMSTIPVPSKAGKIATWIIDGEEGNGSSFDGLVGKSYSIVITLTDKEDVARVGLSLNNGDIEDLTADENGDYNFTYIVPSIPDDEYATNVSVWVYYK